MNIIHIYIYVYIYIYLYYMHYICIDSHDRLSTFLIFAAPGRRSVRLDREDHDARWLGDLVLVEWSSSWSWRATYCLISHATGARFISGFFGVLTFSYWDYWGINSYLTNFVENLVELFWISPLMWVLQRHGVTNLPDGKWQNRCSDWQIILERMNHIYILYIYIYIYIGCCPLPQ